MAKINSLIILIAAAVIAVSSFLFAQSVGCAQEQQSRQNSAGEGVYSDPEIQIKIRTGNKITILLDSNPTTGYSWRLAQPLDERVLKLIDSKYQAPQTHLIGAGGKELWIFEATGSGKAEISFQYVRPWEKDVPPVKQETFTVVVE